MIDKKDLSELMQLLMPISVHYDYLIKERIEEEKRKKDEEDKILIAWGKFRKLKDNKIIEEICALISNDIEKGVFYGNIDGRIFLNTSIVKDYFLSKEIDVDYGIVERGGVKIGNKLFDYFSYYGAEEKLRWNNIAHTIKINIEELQKNYNIRIIKEKEDRFVQKAIELNLMDVTQAHIKNIANELGEDINGLLGQLSVAVSVKLKKHWGNNLPKYNKRGITSSRRVDVFSRDGSKCDQCGRTKEEIGLHIQHITPESCGGTDEMDNLITLCSECNLSIGNSKYNPSPKWIKTIGSHLYNRWGRKDK